MYRSFLSWRYMHARRTNWIGIVGILVGVGALILINSIMAGFLEQSRETVRGSLSDLVIEPIVMAAEDGSAVPARPEPLLEAILEDERVEAAAAHLTWYAMIAREGRASAITEARLNDPEYGRLVGAQVIGVDAEDELATTHLREALERRSQYGIGRVYDVDRPFDPPPDLESDEPWLGWCVLGDQLAQAHFLQRGSEINLATVVPDPESGQLRQCNRKFLVAGVFRTGENEADQSRIYVDRKEMADFLQTKRTYSQVVCRLRNYDREGRAVQAALYERLTGEGLLVPKYRGQVQTWEDQRKNLLGAIRNEKALLGIMLSLVLLVAGFTVFAILSMLVTEKRRDIGILTALGAPPRGILSLYLLIGLWDALIGAALGAAIGVTMAIHIDSIEKWLSSTLGVQIFDRTVYYFDHIPSVIHPFSVAAVVGGAFVSALLFAAIPAWRAGRLHPIDALRYE